MTNIDHEIDQSLTDVLTQLAPGVPVLSEEREIRELPSRYWMIDPIDGTANLISGLPFVGVAVALVEEATPVCAAVADIWHNRTFSAAAGEGAFCDDQKMSLPTEPAELIGVSSGVLARSASMPDLVEKIRGFGKIRNLGSQALQLCFVANGGLCANISLEAKLWDDIAASLIVREAGGLYISAPEGRDADSNQRSYACHPAVADQLAPLAEALISVSQQEVRA